MGLDQTIEREQHDRCSFDKASGDYCMGIPSGQMKLYRAVLAAKKASTKLVVVLVHGGALTIEEIKVSSSSNSVVVW
jgi:hypothetical protein